MRPIEIVGGGLAGLTLGIALCQQGVPVCVREAGKYPRHRVCGEFISGGGLLTLERLGLMEQLMQAGAQSASSARLFTREDASRVRRLPRPALCLSRFVLDELLANIFRNLGGTLECRSVVGKRSDTPGVVQATGRQAQSTEGNYRWYGLKAHARNVSLEADLELHFLEHGYVGLCRLGSGEVNVCGLFRSAKEDSKPQRTVIERLQGTNDSLLKAKFGAAEWDLPSVCAVAGLSFTPRSPQAISGISIGDALTMTPPFTGNGMSIAFESAEVALQPLLEYAKGLISWDAATGVWRERANQHFSRRLRCAQWLHSLAFRAGCHGFLLRLLSKSDLVWRAFFFATR